MNHDLTNPMHQAALPVRAGLMVLVLTGGFLSGSAEGAGVTSWGWRTSLAQSGLGEVKAQSLSASATTATLIQAAPENVVEPAATTKLLDRQTVHRDLAPARYDVSHPRLGPLLGEEALLKAGNTATASSFNGLLPNTPYYNFFRWKRSLDATRFDAKHPRLGALLAEDQRVRNLITAASTNQAQDLVPPTGAGGTHDSAFHVGGSGITAAQLPAVPEPTSLALLLLGSGAILARRLRTQRQRDLRR